MKEDKDLAPDLVEDDRPYTRIDRIKNHLSENKVVYISTAAGVVLSSAATAAVLMTKKPELVNAKIVQGLALWSPPTIQIHIEALGDPGNIIQDVESGTVYASQGQAARELGVTPTAISQHLSGKTPHVRGRRFTKLGKAPVSE